MKKIKAYSLVELMVVMVIGTITIAVAYQGYLLFYQQFLSFKTVVNHNAELSLFDALLDSDIKDSKEVKKRASGIVCRYKEREVLYNWSDNYVTRKQELVTDTFYFKISNLKLMFNSKDAQDNELIDELSFEKNDIKEEVTPFIYKKWYGADVLINSEIKKIF
jgi:prepilin-type N-terminal cleavage/methylation domain-containing protein